MIGIRSAMGIFNPEDECVCRVMMVNGAMAIDAEKILFVGIDDVIVPGKW